MFFWGIFSSFFPSAGLLSDKDLAVANPPEEFLDKILYHKEDNKLSK